MCIIERTNELFCLQVSPKTQKKQPQPQQQLASLVELAKKKAEGTGSAQGAANQVQIVPGALDRGLTPQVESEKTGDISKTSPGMYYRTHNI